MSPRLRLAVTGSCLLVLLLITWILSAPLQSVTEPVQLPRRNGTIYDARLGSEAAHEYTIVLEAGDFVHLVIEQKGVDAEVSLSGPGNEQVLMVDTPVVDQGAEHLYWVAGASGEYRLQVTPWSGSGRYRVRLDTVRPATARDHDYARAARIFSDAEQLRRATALHEAEEAYQKALTAWRAVNDDYQQGLTFRRLATVYYQLGDVAQALALNQEALTVFQRLGNRQQEAALQNRVGRCRRLLGRPDEAAISYSSALEAAEEIDFYQAEASALHNLGMLRYFRGDYLGALRRLEKALDVLDEAGDQKEAANTLDSIGATYCLAGNPDVALDRLGQALGQRDPDDHSGLAQTLTQIGWAHFLKDSWNESIDCYSQALEHQRAINDSFGEATTLSRLASSLYELGREDEALQAYLESLLFFAGRYRLEEAHTLVSLARLQIGRGYPQVSVSYCRRAAAIFQEFGDENGEASSHLIHAQAERALGKLEEAHDQAAAALELIDGLRTLPSRQSLETSYFSARYQYYGLYIELLMEMHTDAPKRGYSNLAFEAFERSRARTLLDSLAQAVPLDHDEKTAAQEALVAQVQERERLEAGLAAPGNSASEKAALRKNLDTVDQKLRELETDLERIEDTLFLAESGHEPLTSTGTLKLQDMKDLLDDDTVLLAYALGERSSHLWLLDRSSCTAFPLPPRAEIEELADRTFVALAGSRNTEVIGQAKLLTQKLSSMILGPVDADLSDKRLLIVADGLLAFVPFAALPTPDGMLPRPSREQRLLIEDHEIVSIPSLSILNELRLRRRQQQPRPQELAIFADPLFSAHDPRVTPGPQAETPHPDNSRSDNSRSDNSRSDISSLDRLPFATGEAQVIAQLVPEDQRMVALGSAASRVNVLRADLSQYRILHFSTHGLLHKEFPRLSGLAMSMVDSQGKPRQGYVRDFEIAQLRLPVELVVLGACKTAQGKVARGEGVLNLSRSFMQAGAARVIMSLWKVSDLASAELMERFYKALLEKQQSPGEALRSAQLGLMREPDRQAPFYWAGFVLQGDWEKLPPREPSL